MLSESIINLSRKLPPLKILFPFVRTVSNVMNENLNFVSPIGYKRAYFGYTGEGIPTKEESYRLKAKANIGLLATTSVLAMALTHKNEQAPEFEITASGPRNYNEKKQFLETKVPFSIGVKINGKKRWFSYKDSLLALPLGALGGFMDSYKYDKLSEKDLINRTAYAFKQIPVTIFNMNFLSSSSNLMDFLSGKSNADINKDFNLITNPIKSILVPSMLRDIAKVYDPTIYSSENVAQTIVKDIPYVRDFVGNKPMLNVFGEKIKFGPPIISRFYANKKEDKVFSFLTNNDLSINPPKKFIADRDMTPDEYYEFIKTSGPKIKKEIEKNLNYFKTLPKDQVQDMINDIAKAYRKQARLDLIKKMNS
jgi:hypothetical protein